MRNTYSFVLRTQMLLSSRLLPVSLFIIALAMSCVISLSFAWQTHAVTPPDTCFAFSAGTITGYYDNEGNNSANPACPKDVDIPAAIGGVGVVSIGNQAFQSKQLTAVTIPSSVITIGFNAFVSNQLATITIPNSVTSIGGSAFNSNQLTSATLSSSLTSISPYTFTGNRLTSITIPSSVTSIGDNAFALNQLTTISIQNGVTSIGANAFMANRLTSVTIPNSVTDIHPTAFGLQNQWGGDVMQATNGAPNIYSGDPAEFQRFYDNIWYVQAYTANPSNPNNLHDGVMDENYLFGDGNANGANDSVGGHLINATPAILNFTDSSGTVLQPAETYTGILTDGTKLINYLAAHGPVIPTVADPSSGPTPAEQAAIDAVLVAYYRIDDTFTYVAPVINGIAPKPASYSFVLGATAPQNTKVFTYATAVTAPASPGGLANTGQDIREIIITSGVAVIFGGAMIIHRTMHPRNKIGVIS